MIRTAQLLFLAVFCVWSVCGQRPPPNYSLDDMPVTSFDCRDKSIGGYYSDPEAECQMFHVCVKLANNDVQDFRFLCPNDTVFDQENQICANWFDIDCEANSLYYAKGFDLLRIGHGVANEDLLQKTPLVPERRLPPANRQRDDQDIFRGSSSSDIHRGRDEEDLEHQKSKNKQKPANRKGGRRRPIATVTAAPETRFNDQDDFTTVTRNQPSSSFKPSTENVETTRHFTTAPNQQFSTPVQQQSQQPNYQQPPPRNNFQQQSSTPQRNNFQQQQSPAPQRNNFQQQQSPAPQRNNFQQQQSPAPQRNNFQQQSPAPQRNNFQQQQQPSPAPAPQRNDFQQSPNVAEEAFQAPKRSKFQINVPNRQQDAPPATSNRGKVTFQNDQGNNDFQSNRNQVPGDVARSQTRNLQQNQQNVPQQNVQQQQNVPQQRRNNFRNKQRVQSNFAPTPVPTFQESSPTADPTLLTPTFSSNHFVSSTFQPQSIPTSTFAPTTYKGQYTEPSTATISPATYNAFQTRKNQQRKGGFNSTPLPNSIGNEQRTFASSQAPTFQQSVSPAFSQPQQQNNFNPTTYRPRTLNNVPQPFQQRRVPPPPPPRDDFINDQHPDELLKTAHSSSFRASDLNSIQKSRPASTTVSPFGAPSSPRSFTPPRQPNKPVQPESRRINNNQFNQFNNQPSTPQFNNQPSTQQFNKPTENVFVTQSTTPNPIGFTGTHFFNPSTPVEPSSTVKPVFNQQFTASTPSSFNQQSAFTQSTPRPFQQQNQQNLNRQQNQQPFQQTDNQQNFNKQQSFNNQQTTNFNNNRQQSNFNQQQTFNRQPQQNFNNQQQQQQSQQTFNKQSFNEPTNNNFFSASTSKPIQQFSKTTNTFFTSPRPVNQQQFSGAFSNSTPRTFETVKSTVYTPSSPAPFQSNNGKKAHKKANSDYDYAYYDDSPADDYEGIEHIPSEFSKTKSHKN